MKTSRKRTNKPAVPSVGSEILSRLKKFSEALETQTDLAKRFTCRTVQLNLRPQSYDAALVKKTRRTLGASHSIFSQFMGVSVQAVHDWEQGLKPPGGAACRLMDEIRGNPDYWIARTIEANQRLTACDWTLPTSRANRRCRKRRAPARRRSATSACPRPAFRPSDRRRRSAPSRACDRFHAPRR